MVIDPFPIRHFGKALPIGGQSHEGFRVGGSESPLTRPATEPGNGRVGVLLILVLDILPKVRHSLGGVDAPDAIFSVFVTLPSRPLRIWHSEDQTFIPQEDFDQSQEKGVSLCIAVGNRPMQ